METTVHGLTLLERAQDRKQQDEVEQRRKDAQQQEDSLINRRRTFGWDLARVLELGYDAYQKFPDDSFPGQMEWNTENKEWIYKQDGLAFVPCPYYSADLVLLQGNCSTCDGLAYQQVSHLTQLVGLLTSKNGWECDYCRARQVEKEESVPDLEISEEAQRCVPSPAPAEQRLLDALKEWVEHIIVVKLSEG